MIFLGPPGVGKTHLSVALAEAAIHAGLGAYFITAYDLATDLATDLGRAYREGRLDRRMRIYLAPKVLVIDEVGYPPLDDLGTTIFFQLVSARYERSSIILTSNKSYGDCGSIFGDPIIATAILDRLPHHSTTVNIRGESYRLKDRRKAGLVPPQEQERPRPRRQIRDLQGWGIFDRRNGEFSSGVDKSARVKIPQPVGGSFAPQVRLWRPGGRPLGSVVQKDR